MAWWKLRDWFNKSDPAEVEPVTESVAALPIFVPPPDTPSVWVRLNPTSPYQGLDLYDDSFSNPYPHAILVTGLTLMEARSNLVGKVLNWTRLTPEQLDALEKHRAFILEYAELKRMFL